VIIIYSSVKNIFLDNILFGFSNII